MAQAVCPQLHDEGMRPVPAHHSLHDIFKEFVEAVIRDAGLEGDVEGVVSSLVLPDFIDVASAREEVFSVLVEGNCHDPVGQEKSLFDSITVMYINVQV